MSKQLELEQEAKYIRLIGGTVVYISDSEALAEEVLTTTGDRLGEWNRLVQEANLVKERISILHQAMRDDEQSPSQYQTDYDMLWHRYIEIVWQLRQINPESVDQFKDKVVAKVKEVEVRLDVIFDAWDPDDEDVWNLRQANPELEWLLVLYEKLYDLAVALGWKRRSRSPTLILSTETCSVKT